jgi:sRNA-binding protein
MSTSYTGRIPGGEGSTPKKEKPGGNPGFRNEKTEAQYIRLPRYKPAAQLLALLQEQYAVIRDYKPLATGTHDTVRASYLLFSRTAVRIALKFHTHSLAYLKNLAAGGCRFDLRGEPWGLITPEHQQEAWEKLAARRKAPEQKASPTPCANPAAAANPANAEDRTDDAVASRLKGTRPTL